MSSGPDEHDQSNRSGWPEACAVVVSMAMASPASREEAGRSRPRCSNGGAVGKKVRGGVDGADEGEAASEARVAGRERARGGGGGVRETGDGEEGGAGGGGGGGRETRRRA